jgi:hypothetical protein
MNPENSKTQSENEAALELPEPPPNLQPSVFLFDFDVLQLTLTHNYILGNWRDC